MIFFGYIRLKIWPGQKISTFCGPFRCMQKKNQLFMKNFYCFPLFLRVQLSGCEKNAAPRTHGREPRLGRKVPALPHEEPGLRLGPEDRRDGPSPGCGPSTPISRSPVRSAWASVLPRPTRIPGGLNSNVAAWNPIFPSSFWKTSAPNREKAHLRPAQKCVKTKTFCRRGVLTAGLSCVSPRSHCPGLDSACGAGEV